METQQQLSSQKMARKQVKHRDQLDQQAQNHNKEVHRLKSQLKQLDDTNRQLEISMGQQRPPQFANMHQQAPNQSVDFAEADSEERVRKLLRDLEKQSKAHIEEVN